MNHAPFLTRVGLAFSCWFKILGDAAFARRVRDVASGVAPELPPAPVASPVREPEPPSRSSEQGALALLALLQREGRLLDFVQQDIRDFSDADVGAAARVVHEGCRRALDAHLTIETVRAESESARVTVEPDFDPDAVKLTGNVHGSGPFTGTLRHRGWRAARVNLPELVGSHDRTVLAPAEVEL